jgi:tetratricopeptide (TPR) repeat protein
MTNPEILDAFTTNQVVQIFRGCRCAPAFFLAVLVLLSGNLGCQVGSSYNPNLWAVYRGQQHFETGVAAMNEGDFETAEYELAEAVELRKNDPVIRRQYAELLARSGKTVESVEELEQAVQLDDGTDASLYVAIARQRLQLGQVDYALAAVEQAVQIDPQSAEVWRVQGDVWLAYQRLNDALAAYHRALNLAPDDRNLPLAIAEVYLMRQQPDRALAALQNVGERWTSDREPQRILFLKGVAHSKLGRHSEAEQCYVAALNNGEPNPEILCRLAEARLASGQTFEAEQAARQALALNGEHQASRRVLDQIAVATGQAPLIR